MWDKEEGRKKGESEREKEVKEKGKIKILIDFSLDGGKQEMRIVENLVRIC